MDLGDLCWVMKGRVCLIVLLDSIGNFAGEASITKTKLTCTLRLLLYSNFSQTLRKICRNIQPNIQEIFPLPRSGTKRARCVFRKADLEKISASQLRSFIFCILVIDIMNRMVTLSRLSPFATLLILQSVLNTKVLT